MKSVSFSDLRKSSDMANRSDQISNSGDSIMKRSSSYKSLTHYSSSEDILKRFSSKTSDLKTCKDISRYDDKRIGHISNPSEEILIETQDERYHDSKMSTSDRTIADLRAIISEQEKTIAALQEKNLVLQNESSKTVEEKKFQENRINYLEHMLSAFNTDVHDSRKMLPQTSEDNISNVVPNKRTVPSYSDSRGRANLNGDGFNENFKSSTIKFTKETQYNNDALSDFHKRPSSADSSLYNGYKYADDVADKNRRSQGLQSSIRNYTSDSEDRLNFSQTNNAGQKIIPADAASWQRQKLDRDRSVNLSDFKSRLEEFTKYAKRSTEQNSLNQQRSSDFTRSCKFSAPSDAYLDQQYKGRTKVQNQSGDSRPPIDPYYKQRRGVPPETKVVHDRPSYSSINKIQDMTEEEDEHLKERVQKILEKHKYPSNTYGGENSRKLSEYSFKSNNDHGNYGSVDAANVRRHERNPTDLRYNYQANGRLETNDSNIPRLDLSLYNPSSDDLIAKYLNYQGSTNVS